MRALLISLAFIAPFAWATPQAELSERLGKVDAFTADFEQTVTSPDGDVINQGAGELAIQRPNLFNWTTVEPDENILISDGKTLWYYSPFIEQVTAMWLEDATAQTPFVLLTRNQSTDWDSYDVSQQGNLFTLVPKESSTLGKFTLEVTPQGDVTRFAVIEQDGQTSEFVLDEVSHQQPQSDLFRFTPPEGVELDDQRVQ